VCGTSETGGVASFLLIGGFPEHPDIHKNTMQLKINNINFFMVVVIAIP